MQTRHIVVIASLTIAAGAAAWVAFAPRPTQTPAPIAAQPAPPVETPIARSSTSSRPPAAKPAGAVEPQPAAPAPTAPPAPARADPLDKVAIGREALARVGKDPQATELWVMLINDLSVPAAARKDLIEDLNEDGFSDPKNPTEEDLPLIRDRIELIHKLAPSAMDNVNARAFLEAHKDLQEMLARLSPQQ
ncbi:MAG: hypothetical protein ACREJO_13330 [Phycisphaerales bacterium]